LPDLHSVPTRRSSDPSNRAGLVEEQKDYVWRATLREGRLKLTGYVPNEATRRAIIGTAKASFPDLEIQDRMQLARGAPNTEVWLDRKSTRLNSSHVKI